MMAYLCLPDARWIMSTYTIDGDMQTKFWKHANWHKNQTFQTIGKYVRLILSSFAGVSPCLISFGNRYDVVKTTEPSWDVDKRWVQYLLDTANCPRAVKRSETNVWSSVWNAFWLLFLFFKIECFLL